MSSEEERKEDMEGTGGAEYLEDDRGLDFLIPLLIFMHRTCLKTICCFLVRHFRDTDYVREKMNTSIGHKMTLTSFLSQVDQEGKDRKKKEGGNKKGKQQQGQQPSVSPQQQFQRRQQPLLSSGPVSSRGQKQQHQQPSTSSHPCHSKQQQWFQQQQPLLSSHPLSSKQHYHHFQHCRQFQRPLVSPHNSKHQRHQQWGYSHSQHQQKQQQQSPQSHPKSQKDLTNQLNQSMSQHKQLQRQSAQQFSKSQQSQNCPNQLSQSTSHHQQKTQGQLSTQTMNDLDNRRPSDVQNIKENKEILDSVTVGDLMQGDAACQELEKLDINFVLNTVLNKVIAFPLNQELCQAILKIKDVRKALVHPKYHFTQEDFDGMLSTLEDAVDVLYRHLSLDQQKLTQSVAVCRQDANSGSKVLLILRNLASEAHKKYVPLDASFVLPDITLLQTSGKEVIKDLNKFIEGQQDPQNLILLSGEHREEKTQLLESLASTLKDHGKFRLVVLVNERDRWHYHHLWTQTKSTSEHSAATLQDQVFACLSYLAPDTVHRYGLDSVKTAISGCQKDILFLVNWNINKLGPVRSEVEEGTWVLTYEGKEPPLVDWKVLRVELYTQAQVLKMINSHPSCKILKRCYDNFDNKDILSSLDMIHIFWEVCGGVSVGTDFEVVERYVQKYCGGNIHTGEQEKEMMMRLSEAAFYSVYEAGFISKDINIQQHLRESFLCPVKGKGWSFKHSNVRDFMAANYVIANPSEACKKWVRGNVVAFKRVFKFSCFMWCRSHSEKKYLPHMEAFLRIFLSAPKKEKKTKCSGQEAWGDENEMSDQMKKMEKEECDKKQRDHFDSWDFLLELDEACFGKERVLKQLMSILSDIPCWCFNAAECLGLEKKLTRLEKVLKLATLDKDNPLIIKLKTNTNMKLITELWNKLRRMKAMYGSVSIMLAIEEGEDSSQNPRNEIEDFFKTVVDTQVPLHITRYKGPLFPSSISKFLKCVCMQNLEILEVCVNDVLSLQEVVSCGAKEMHIMVNLESSEQSNLIPFSIVFPSGVSMYITIDYFHNIQQLLDCFKGCQQLRSLSIHDLHVLPDFRLNLSAFSQLETLNLRFRPETVDRRPLAPGEETMDVEDGEGSGDRLPRSSWLPHLLLHLTLPEKLRRLLLRNINFLSDSNQNLINELFQKHSIKRFVILDTRLSFIGARMILSSQTEEEEEEAKHHGGGRRLKRTKSLESIDMGELAAKRTRLSQGECDAMEVNQADGMEVVITADGKLCFDCCCFPCMCVSKVGHEDGSSTYSSMDELINNMHTHSVQCYSYSFDHCTTKQNECGDLLVECIMKGLSDADVQEMDSWGYLSQLFLPLTLAQAVTLEGTALSPLGTADVAEHLKKIEGTEIVQPFALTVETCWHSSDSTSLQGLKDFLGTADYLSVFHYKCGCSPKCFHIEKTLRGDIKDLAYES